MLRREIRKRKEYLYVKNKESLEKATIERKKKLRSALEEGKSIPTELYQNESELRKLMTYDDSRWDKKDEIDNEYRYAGAEDPKIVVTTSRNPSSRLKMFVKEVRLIFPNCQKINRGQAVLKELVISCISANVTDLVLLHETRGVPDCLVISHLPYGPTAFFTLFNVVMRHDIPEIGTMSEAFPHLVFHNFTKPLGKRIMNILKYLFPVPKDDSKHHVYNKDSSSKNNVLQEVGPRFEMKLFRVTLGTITQTEAENEWQLKPFMNTARKRMFIGEKDELFDNQDFNLINS